MVKRLEIKQGIPVSPGYAIEKAFVLEAQDYRIVERFIPASHVDLEIKRFKQAVDAAATEIEGIADRARKAGVEYASIFDAHYAILKDPQLRTEVEKLIKAKRWVPEYAVNKVLKNFIDALRNVKDELYAQRASDFTDILRRILRHLTGKKISSLEQAEGQSVLVARDLTPSQTASLDTSKVIGFATDLGGKTSHTAIMAGALRIPAVVGLGSISADVQTGDILIIDGFKGKVIINPDPKTRKRYEKLKAEYGAKLEELATIRDLPSETKDGTAIKLLANIEIPQEIEYALEVGADGVGLLRTEFLFDQASDVTDEKPQYETYVEVIKSLAPKPVIIRTLDMGGDKFFDDDFPVDPNPFLGSRSIRICLERLDIFKPQLRAILRAAMFGDVSIMIPMISSIDEIKAVKTILEDVEIELAADGLEYKKNVPLGIMVEVPSAAIAINILMPEVDFVSIGTNDLVQYTLAVDRSNRAVSDYYQPANPAVLELIQKTISAGKKHGKPVSICGEMAGDIIFTPLLVGMGCDSFSASPGALLAVKSVIRSINMKDAEKIARKCFEIGSSSKIEEYLANELATLSTGLFVENVNFGKKR